MKLLGLGEGGFEATALFGENVNEDGHVGVPGEFQVFLQRLKVVSIHRSEIAQAEFFKQGRLDKKVLRLAFPLMIDAIHAFTGGEALKEALDVVVQLVVSGIGAEAVKVGGDSADVLGDGPLVVVEDDDQSLR